MPSLTLDSIFIGQLSSMKTHPIVKHICFCLFLFFNGMAKSKELANPDQEKLFFKIPSPSKNFKTKPHNPRQDSGTATLQRDNFSLADSVQTGHERKNGRA